MELRAPGVIHHRQRAVGVHHRVFHVYRLAHITGAAAGIEGNGVAGADQQVPVQHGEGVVQVTIVGEGLGLAAVAEHQGAVVEPAPHIIQVQPVPEYDGGHRRQDHGQGKQGQQYTQQEPGSFFLGRRIGPFNLLFIHIRVHPRRTRDLSYNGRALTEHLHHTTGWSYKARQEVR